MEIVFEKEIESVSNVVYFYSNQLVLVLDKLMRINNNFTIAAADNNSSDQTNLANAISECFSDKYNLICDRLANETQTTIELINENKMAYNDVKYTKLVCLMMFLRTLAGYCSKENTKNRQIVFNKLLEHDSYLNCYMKSYLI
jgi:hypothetical protein